MSAYRRHSSARRTNVATRATCTRDRGQLGLPDDELIALAVDQGFAFVTNNHADFRASARALSCTQGWSSFRTQLRATYVATVASPQSSVPGTLSTWNRRKSSRAPLT